MSTGKSEILLDVPWRWQTVSFGCLPACLSMLFSHQGETCETYEVIEKSCMPYRISYLAEDDRFLAGTAFEYDSVTRKTLAAHYGFELFSQAEKNFGDYLNKTWELLRHETPFVTSVNPYYMSMSSSGYDDIRKSEPGSIGHAVVVQGIDPDHFYILDPGGGIQSEAELHDPDHISRVKYRTSHGDFLRAIEHIPGRKYVMGRVEPSERSDLPQHRSLGFLLGRDGHVDGYDGLLMNGIKALKVLPEKMTEFSKLTTMKSPKSDLRSAYLRMASRYVRSFLRGYKGAIQASRIFHQSDDRKRTAYENVLAVMERLEASFSGGLEEIENAGVLSRRSADLFVSIGNSFLKQMQAVTELLKTEDSQH